jgi:hypothetical protein
VANGIISWLSDLSGDGQITGFDIDPFVELTLGGS